MSARAHVYKAGPLLLAQIILESAKRKECVVLQLDNIRMSSEKIDKNKTIDLRKKHVG